MKKTVKISRRLRFVIFFFILLFFGILAKVFYIQIIKSGFYRSVAAKQHQNLIPVKGERGFIYDSCRRVMAMDISSYSVYADPGMIKEKDACAQDVSGVLSVPLKNVREKLDVPGRFVWLKRNITWPEKESIEQLDIPGIALIRGRKRFYPQNILAAHVLGGVNSDNMGIEGLELAYDKYLRGKDGMATTLKDSSSRSVIFSSDVVAPERGADIHLTIDGQIQFWVDFFLKKTVDEYKAKAGSIVVMDPDTGRILALGNYPFYDPNTISGSTEEQRRNRAITDVFEPGSVFKIVTLCGSLSERLYSEHDIIGCENGIMKIPGTTLHDFKAYSQLEFQDVFKKSSNIGTAKIAAKLGKDKLYAYIKKMGFGSVSGIDLKGEVPGLLKDVKSWSKTSPYIIPIGQEIGITALQLARAMCAIVNGGYLVKPYLVDKMVSDKFSKDYAVSKKKVLSEDVCERAKNILTRVVSGDGTGRYASVSGATVGGKTGTAQKFDTSIGKYSSSAYRASFVGFVEKGPVKFVMAVSIDEPSKSHLGGRVAAPLFRDIATETLKYLEKRKFIEG